jgi:O-antigen/teichoic acid export membrane protein
VTELDASAPSEQAALAAVTGVDAGHHPAPVTGQRVGRSLKNAVVFGAGTALQRGIAFALLPVYTRALAPAQYGVLSVLLAVTSAANILFAFGLDMGLFRSFFLYADDPLRKRAFLGSVWRFLLLAPVAGSVVLTAIVSPFLVGTSRVTALDVLLCLLAGAFYVGASTVPLVVMRVEQRLRDFTVLSVVDAIATPSLTLLLVVWLNDGITGWLVAAASSNAILLVAALRIVPWDRGAPFDRSILGSALRFGVTLVPHALALWALFLIDRGVLAGLVSARELGIYSLAANVGLPVVIALQALNQAMMPAYASAGTNPGEREHLARLVVVQIAVTFVICLAGTLLGGPLLVLIVAHSYDRAAPLVAWIVLGYAFIGMYFVPMNGITLGAGKSGFVWVASILGVTTNVGLLLIFVPSGGITAAAIATAGAFLVLLMGIAIYAHHPRNPVRYKWRQILPLAALAGTVYIAARLTTPSVGAVSILIRSAWIAVFILVCVFGYKQNTRSAKVAVG